MLGEDDAKTARAEIVSLVERSRELLLPVQGELAEDGRQGGGWGGQGAEPGDLLVAAKLVKSFESSRMWGSLAALLLKSRRCDRKDCCWLAGVTPSR